ncbi:MAG: hypothetical protein M3Y84_12505 [Acidobacteriota bacterium]|nr:hypothetical protein [Acidobacteriota bacterium]
MFWLNRNTPLVIIGFVLLIVSSTAARPRKMQRLVSSTWGGQHISIEVNRGSASIEYDCATGTIDGPLTLDSKGHFTWRGYYNREHGGPVRIDEKSNRQPAIYNGWIQGDNMTLTVNLANSKESLGTYTLMRGSSGRVWKCK